MLSKSAGGERFVDHLLRAIGALATATCNAQALRKFSQRMRAIDDRFANLAFSNPVAKANVHGTPASRWPNPKS